MNATRQDEAINNYGFEANIVLSAITRKNTQEICWPLEKYSAIKKCNRNVRAIILPRDSMLGGDCAR